MTALLLASFHSGRSPLSGDVLALTLPAPGGWQLMSPVIIWILIAAVAYQNGRLALRRMYPRSPLLSPTYAAAFWFGLALVAVALLSPLDVWAEQLFAFHMTQHLILGIAAPLLFVVCRPLQVSSFGLKPATRRLVVVSGHKWSARAGVSRTAIGIGLLAVASHVIVFLGWHYPVFYDAAVRHSEIHILEHLSMFVTGLLLWWAVIGIGWRVRSATAVLYLFLAGLPMGALAALLTFAPSPLYTSHLATTTQWGLTPLQDQQLAGGIMWVPGGAIYLVLAVVLFVRWLGAGPAPGATPFGAGLGTEIGTHS